MSAQRAALAELLVQLRRHDYAFVTPTPATHARVMARRGHTPARDLRDVFGWSLPFAPKLLPSSIVRVLEDGDLLEQHGERLRSLVRVSSLDSDLFVHSAFPTTRQDSVFFGPDSYRFARFLHRTIPSLGARTAVIDIGTGAGVGAISAARALASAFNLSVAMTDINPLALEYARANWTFAGVNGDGGFYACDSLSAVDSEPDLIIANPPYMADPAHRAYRDGGGDLGAGLSVRWAQDAAQRLRNGGAFLLYSGSAVTGGEHVLRAPLLAALEGFEVRYSELDPDVFGEELEREEYAEVERIAVVGVVAIKR